MPSVPLLRASGGGRGVSRRSGSDPGVWGQPPGRHRRPDLSSAREGGIGGGANRSMRLPLASNPGCRTACERRRREDAAALALRGGGLSRHRHNHRLASICCRILRGVFRSRRARVGLIRAGVRGAPRGDQARRAPGCSARCRRHRRARSRLKSNSDLRAGRSSSRGPRQLRPRHSAPAESVLRPRLTEGVDSLPLRCHCDGRSGALECAQGLWAMLPAENSWPS
jgi:hypothetical protein